MSTCTTDLGLVSDTGTSSAASGSRKPARNSGGRPLAHTEKQHRTWPVLHEAQTDGQPPCASEMPDACMDTMKDQLQALRQENPAAVFVARRISKLGFSSSDKLREHFSWYGPVRNVFVPHSQVKSKRQLATGQDQRAGCRVRAASLGFVVMGSVEAAAEVFRDGSDHLVGGVLIKVQPFRQRTWHELGGALHNAGAEAFRVSPKEAPPVAASRAQRPSGEGVQTPAVFRGVYAELESSSGKGTEPEVKSAWSSNTHRKAAAKAPPAGRRPAPHLDAQSWDPWDMWLNVSEEELCKAMPALYTD